MVCGAQEPWRRGFSGTGSENDALALYRPALAIASRVFALACDLSRGPYLDLQLSSGSHWNMDIVMVRGKHPFGSGATVLIAGALAFGTPGAAKAAKTQAIGIPLPGRAARGYDIKGTLRR
jgi:hypothetical protein